MENDRPVFDGADDGKPPVLSTWNRLYALVFFNLVALIVLFYVFTRIFQ